MPAICCCVGVWLDEGARERRGKVMGGWVGVGRRKRAGLRGRVGGKGWNKNGRGGVGVGWWNQNQRGKRDGGLTYLLTSCAKHKNFFEN